MAGAPNGNEDSDKVYWHRYVPRLQDLNLAGLDIKEETVREAMRVDLAEWEPELESQKEWFDKLGKTLPRPLALQRELLLERVKGALRVSK